MTKVTAPLRSALHHAGRADIGVLVKFQGIGEGSVEATPEYADGLQASHGAHHHAAIDDRQILALEQHDAEIAGDIGVLEIGFVGGTR